MSDGRLYSLELESAAASLRHFGAARGMSVREARSGADGVRFVLGSAAEPDDLFFALLPRGGGYLSLSLVLVVDEDFFYEHVNEILGVTAEYEVCANLSKDGKLEEGEVYLNLLLRIFLPGFLQPVFDLALENLRAARDALARSFP